MILRCPLIGPGVIKVEIVVVRLCESDKMGQMRYGLGLVGLHIKDMLPGKSLTVSRNLAKPRRDNSFPLRQCSRCQSIKNTQNKKMESTQ